MSKNIEFPTNADPYFHKSETITRNDDGTYKIEQVFENAKGNKMTQEYPSVEMKVETELAPFGVSNIKEKDGVLFTVTIEE